LRITNLSEADVGRPVTGREYDAQVDIVSD